MADPVMPARVVVVLAAALAAGCASGGVKEEPAPRENPFTACRSAEEDRVRVLDATRRRVHETVCGASLWFDGLFGERDLASARTAHGRIEVSTANSEFEGEQTRVRFDARVQLPALERRVFAFIGRDDEDDVAQDSAEGLGLRSQAEALSREEEDDWFAGLAYRIREALGIRSEFRVGVRDLSDPTAFAQLRNTLTAYEGDDGRVQLRLTPFVNTRDHHGATASVDFDHAFSPTRLLRWGSIATVAEESSGMRWRSAVVLYQSLGHLRAVAFEAFERGATTAPEPLLEYGVRTVYREPLFEGRLFAELVLGYSWPRVDPALPREGSAGVTAGLEMPFGAPALAPEQDP